MQSGGYTTETCKVVLTTCASYTDKPERAEAFVPTSHHLWWGSVLLLQGGIFTLLFL